MTVPNVWSSETPQAMKASSPAFLYDSTSSTDDATISCNTLQSVSFNANLFNSPVLGDGFSASHRYIPNEHHRVVANVSLGPARNLTSRSGGKPGPKAAQCVPSVSRYTTISQHFGHQMSSEQYNECYNSQFLHESSSKEMTCMSQMPFYSNTNKFHDADLPLSMGDAQVKDKVAAPEAFMDSEIYCDTSLMFDRRLSTLETPSMPISTFDSSADSGIMKGSFIRSNLEFSDMLAMQQQPPASGSLLQSLYLDAQAHDSGQGHLCQNRQIYKGSQPLLLRPHQPCNPFDQHQLLQKDQYQQQQHHMLAGAKDFIPFHSESISNRSCLMNSNNLLEQVPIKPLTVHDMTKQEQPPTMEEYTWLQSTSLKEVAFDRHSAIQRRPAQYQAIHNVLFLYEHVKHCQDEGKDCNFFQCMNLKRNLGHVLHCKDVNCTKHCFKYKRLFDHYRECCRSTCSICGPVRMRLKEVSERNTRNAFTESKTAFPTVSRLDHEESAFKRAKTMHHFVQNETYEVSLPVMNCSDLTSEGAPQAGQEVSMPVDTATGSGELVEKQTVESIFTNPGEIYDTKIEELEVEIKKELGVESVELAQAVTHSERENVIQLESSKAEISGSSGKCNITLSAAASVTEAKMETPKRVVSLLDTFTPEKLREHIRSLEQYISKDKENTDESQDMEHLIDQNSCSLCGMEKLIFEAPPRYCSSCYKQINPKGVYYTMRSFKSTKYECGAKISFCGKCYGASGESIKVGGEDIRKSNLERRLNYAETDAETEWWVQCDKCKAWQHQICALFNGKRKEALHAEYICPNCYLEELESGKHEPLLQSAVIGANDLPKTMLSNHIEQWIFERLKQEREERARILKKSVDEVPEAEGLIIRVVSSVDKKLEVNPVFREVFKEEMYPTHFPYKSKVILLFQKIEGADVCLFGMYVQEYGSECASPNQRRVCISYIDSVKYFRPEIKAATGEALRTFVYHEILIGYLDYCKKRGFTSCYIWACPSLRQDYYILYCHPKTQKTPKSDKLREWYQTMIRKAMKEKVILEQTNLYDHFFVLTSECKAKVTAARLPYFDSDFWPGKAEILLQEDKTESQTKGTKAVIERALRAAKRDALTGNPKDILLMHQLGEIIRPIKEDFIMIHLQHTCKYCFQPIVSGKQWICKACKNFQLCEQCYDKGQNLDKKDRHPVTTKEKHSFQLVESDILADTDDKDEMIQSKLLDMRTGFLNFCQSEQYQFDTLRRAKHSTMLILYHLHNPSAPALAPSCAICHSNIDTSQNWHCIICQHYYLCDSCYHQKGASHHKHRLVSHATVADCTLQPKEGRNGKANVQIVLDALLHAPKCSAPRCAHSYCLKVKKLFLHSRKCKVRARGGCISCKKIWLLLQRHACACQEFDCHVPRCRDLKDYIRKMRQQGAKERIRMQGRVSESSI